MGANPMQHGSADHPIEGLVGGGDSTLAYAAVPRTAAPDFDAPLGRAKPELVSNPPDAKKRRTTKVVRLFLVPRRGFEPRTPCLKGRCSTD